MFTTGSKLLLGGTVVSIVASIVWGVTNGGASGYIGIVALLSVAVSFAFLFGLNYYIRDGNVPAAAPDMQVESAAAQAPAGRSMWPAITAVGLALLVIGAETKPIVFKAALVVLLAAAVEWMVQGWSERASSDANYNASLRARILHPLELPILGAIGLAVIIYSFSRIMLFLSKANGPWVFIIVGVIIVVFAFTFASRPSLKKSLVVGVCTIGALGLVSTGVVMAIDGQRTIEEYPTTADDDNAACALDEEQVEADEHLKEIDEHASQNVAAKSNPVARVVLENGELHAYIVGYDGPQDTLTIPRANPSNILFTNRDEGKHRLTAYAGTEVSEANGTEIRSKRLQCTTLVREDGELMLTVLFPKASAAAVQDDPYTLSVPGLEGAEITVVVP